MRIGILTFHCAHNYGAMLQAFGLQSFLSKMDNEAYIIDYRPQYLTSPTNIHSWRFGITRQLSKSIKNIFYRLKYRTEQNERYKAFEDFFNEFNLAPIKDLQNFDAFVIGSDQVWSTIICKGFDNLFWGEFPRKSGSKMISYAASIGRSNWNAREREKAASLLNNFNAISVREKSSINIIKGLTKKPVFQVLDPTLLAGKEAFSAIARTSALPQAGNYIITYEVAHMPQLHDCARRMANKLGLAVYNIEAYPTYKALEHPLRTASPKDFVGLIQNAAMVFTNSFHGTCFSILFNKPFYTFKFGNSTDLRSASLLSALGISHRLIEKYEDIRNTEELNYTLVENKLQKLRTESAQFLQNALRS